MNSQDLFVSFNPLSYSLLEELTLIRHPSRMATTGPSPSQKGGLSKAQHIVKDSKKDCTTWSIFSLLDRSFLFLLTRASFSRRRPDDLGTYTDHLISLFLPSLPNEFLYTCRSLTRRSNASKTENDGTVTNIPLSSMAGLLNLVVAVVRSIPSEAFPIILSHRTQRSIPHLQRSIYTSRRSRHNGVQRTSIPAVHN